MSRDDWDPPPGMRKLLCSSCGHQFASKYRVLMCPTCTANPRKRKVKSASPFDEVGTGYQHQAVGIWRE